LEHPHLKTVPQEYLCLECGLLSQLAPKDVADDVFMRAQWIQRDLPILDSWNGNDMFRARFLPVFYCTDKVLELAHKHRWNNFRFDMIDAIKRHANKWNGIDYLSKQWPPDRWYSPAASEGKAMHEWLDILRSEPFPTPPDRSQVPKAYEALVDFGEEIVPELWFLVTEGNADQRKNAAHVLMRLRREIGIPMTDEDRERILEVRPDLSPSALR
jgi:hypothetical protein